jgi:hypothetical protein
VCPPETERARRRTAINATSAHLPKPSIRILLKAGMSRPLNGGSRDGAPATPSLERLGYGTEARLPAQKPGYGGQQA